MSKVFRFKQFELHQDSAVFRLGTDSMLLGSIAQLEGALNILDIGTGTGVLALMMAQKHLEAMVDAVELEAAAAKLAQHNFEQSPWAFRLQVYQQSIQSFAHDPVVLYDLIVCNPPYFEPIRLNKGNSINWPSGTIRKARTQETLNVAELFTSVQSLLAASGLFYMVCPAQKADGWKEEAKRTGFYVVAEWQIANQEGQQPVLTILGFMHLFRTPSFRQMVIKKADGRYSEDYLALTADFHLFNLVKEE